MQASQIHCSTVPRLLGNCAGPILGIVRTSFSLEALQVRVLPVRSPEDVFALAVHELLCPHLSDLDAEPEWKATLATPAAACAGSNGHRVFPLTGRTLWMNALEGGAFDLIALYLTIAIIAACYAQHSGARTTLFLAVSGGLL